MTTYHVCRWHTALAILVMIAAGCGGNVSGKEDATDTGGDGTDTDPDSPLDVPTDPDTVDQPAEAEADDLVPETSDPDAGDPEAGDPDAGDPDASDPEAEDTTCRPRLFILLDRSASMFGDTGERWNMVRQSLQVFLASTAAEGIEYGLGAFPSDSNCAVDDLVVHPLPEADAAAIDSYFGATQPDGNTPVVGAFELLATDTTANLDDGAYLNALLLITDGWESCMIDCWSTCVSEPDPITCLTECQAQIEAEAPLRLEAATIALRDTRGVRTFVIGISEDVKDAQLSAIAANGGTAARAWISALSDSSIQLTLEDIADELKACLPIEP
jgi:hypothetical protein